MAKNGDKKKIIRIIIIGLLMIVCGVLTYYFHTVLKLRIIFTHFFYVPIFLGALWWKRRGLFISVFLAGLLIFSHIFLMGEDLFSMGSDYFRAVMFIAIGVMFVVLSERIARSEERLKRYAADLEQRNEEVKQFAYIVSHDLRAPLVNLKGFSSELRSAVNVIESGVGAVADLLDEKKRHELVAALKEDVPEALGFIESSVTRMDNFISAVLRLSRIGRQELDLESIDMADLVRTT